MNYRYNLIITVPHGFCTESPIRECDLRALSAAKIIGSLYKGKYELIYIPKKRAVVDLNRRRPLGGSEVWDDFNRRIKKKLSEADATPFLLDVHSFLVGDFDGAQIAILELSDIDRSEVREFVNFVMRETSLNIKLLKGRHNYIQDYYSKYSYPLLIEFCEDKNYLTNDDIKIFGKLLFSFFKDKIYVVF